MVSKAMQQNIGRLSAAHISLAKDLEAAFKARIGHKDVSLEEAKEAEGVLRRASLTALEIAKLARRVGPSLTTDEPAMYEKRSENLLLESRLLKIMHEIRTSTTKEDKEAAVDQLFGALRSSKELTMFALQDYRITSTKGFDGLSVPALIAVFGTVEVIQEFLGRAMGSGEGKSAERNRHRRLLSERAWDEKGKPVYVFALAIKTLDSYHIDTTKYHGLAGELGMMDAIMPKLEPPAASLW